MWIIDPSMFRQFRVTQDSRLQFRFEVFNLPNTPNLSAPNSAIDSNTAGLVNSTSTSARQMPVALKYND